MIEPAEDIVLHKLLMPLHKAWCAALLLAFYVPAASAAEHSGLVMFDRVPVPGATVMLMQGNHKLVTVTGQEGVYTFSNVAEGLWTLRIQMQCFVPIEREIAVTAASPSGRWQLELPPATPSPAAVARPGGASPAESTAKPAPAAPLRSGAQSIAPAKLDGANLSESTEIGGKDNVDFGAGGGFLVNGSVNNGAASPFGQSAAFGNSRKREVSLYNGGLSVVTGDSALDARSYSLTGQDTPKPAYYRLTVAAGIGGPLRWQRLFQDRPPNVMLTYQITRNRNASTYAGLVPTAAARAGDLSVLPARIFDPYGGAPFPGNVVPASRVSPQASNLLALYPLPSSSGNTFNYQVPLASNNHSDAVQSRFTKSATAKDYISGLFARQDARNDSTNPFGFLDIRDSSGVNSNVTWRHTYNPRITSGVTVSYSRQEARSQPFFADRKNVSRDAGITGNNQDAANWGPPALSFFSGITGLSDAQQSSERNQTAGFSSNNSWVHRAHHFTFGGDYRRMQFNLLSQQNPRGRFTFTGSATQAMAGGLATPGTGFDFADFLLGIPDASSIAYGNSDKYFRTQVSAAYVTDDWRVRPGLTVNSGIRWDYSSPFVERYGRLVNLDIVTPFTAIAPVEAENPLGPLTGVRYPSSLIRPDKRRIEPRIGIAWHPGPTSSLVIRAGYDLSYNPSLFRSMAQQMSQQPPLSKNLSMQNSPQNPLTLADGFSDLGGESHGTFAADSNIRVGYAHEWNLSIEKNVFDGMVMTATYLGIKGTRLMQEFLPNTYPQGTLNPFAAYPVGYVYVGSNGNSNRNAATAQLRRRLHAGFAATLSYTYAKSLDNAFGGGAAGLIAQNWLDLSAERGRSTFDQRHAGSIQMQYTSGMGLGGGTLLDGWGGRLFKDWTVASQITVGTGLPLTPLYPSLVQGTGIAGSIRPDYTGAPLYLALSSANLNRAAYSAPLPDQWGNAGRDSITGPAQLSTNASLARTFRVSQRINADLRLDSSNPLNHVTFRSWNTTVTSVQFGFPSSANAMRTAQITFRLRF